MIVEVVATRTLPTIKASLHGADIFLHSKYDPMRDVESWVHKHSKRLVPSEKIVVVGMGAGYHIKFLTEIFDCSAVQVIEFNRDFYNWFQNSPFYSDIKALKNVSIHLFERLNSEEKYNVFQNVHSWNILIHESSLKLMPDQYNEIKQLLNDLLIKKKSIQVQEEKMYANITENVMLRDQGIVQWRNYYENQSVLLVSAGPSLNKHLGLLKHISDSKKAIIGAVGTALSPLLKNNLIPDFIMISDPDDVLIEQFAGIDLLSIPLFYLSTANHQTVRQYVGPRHIVWQEGYPDAEELARYRNEPLIQTGGSVATCLLDLMVYMGVAKIGLVGQDLAYTDGMSHANFTHAQREITEGLRLEAVLDYFQNGYVRTSRSLLVFKKWFEQYIIDKESAKFYNCTEGGAYIEGWNHQPLQLFIDEN